MPKPELSSLETSGWLWLPVCALYAACGCILFLPEVPLHMPRSLLGMVGQMTIVEVLRHRAHENSVRQ